MPHTRLGVLPALVILSVVSCSDSGQKLETTPSLSDEVLSDARVTPDGELVWVTGGTLHPPVESVSGDRLDRRANDIAAAYNRSGDLVSQSRIPIEPSTFLFTSEVVEKDAGTFLVASRCSIIADKTGGCGTSTSSAIFRLAPDSEASVVPLSLDPPQLPRSPGAGKVLVAGSTPTDGRIWLTQSLGSGGTHPPFTENVRLLQVDVEAATQQALQLPPGVATAGSVCLQGDALLAVTPSFDAGSSLASVDVWRYAVNAGSPSWELQATIPTAGVLVSGGRVHCGHPGSLLLQLGGSPNWLVAIDLGTRTARIGRFVGGVTYVYADNSGVVISELSPTGRDAIFHALGRSDATPVVVGSRSMTDDRYRYPVGIGVGAQVVDYSGLTRRPGGRAGGAPPPLDVGTRAVEEG